MCVIIVFCCVCVCVCVCVFLVVKSLFKMIGDENECVL